MAAQENATCQSVDHPVVAADEEIVKHKSDGVVELEAQVAQLMKEDDSLKTQSKKTTDGKPALDLDSMRALAKEKREEILQLEKSLRLARETLDSTESRIKTLTSPSLIKIKQVHAWMFNSCISNGAPTVDEAQWKASILSESSGPMPWGRVCVRVRVRGCTFEEAMIMAGKSGNDMMTMEDFIKGFTQRFNALPVEELEQMAPGIIAEISYTCTRAWLTMPARLEKLTALRGQLEQEKQKKKKDFARMKDLKAQVEALEIAEKAMPIVQGWLEKSADLEEYDAAEKYQAIVEALTNGDIEPFKAEEERARQERARQEQLRPAQAATQVTPIQAKDFVKVLGEWTHCCLCGHKLCGTQFKIRTTGWKCGEEANNYKACCKCIVHGYNTIDKNGKPW